MPYLHKNTGLKPSALPIDTLIEYCRAGHITAQNELYRRYSGAMYNTALRIVKDVHFAEDVMQEGFLKAFTKLEDYRSEVAFGAWLKRIVINHSIDFYKKSKRMPMDWLPEISAEPPEEELYAVRASDLNDTALLNAINTLRDNHRLVLTLHYIEGFDHDEISQILDISYSNSRTLLSRAKDSLRKKIFGHEPAQ